MNRDARFALVLAVVSTAFVVPGHAAALRGNLVSVSLPALRIEAGERIVGFQIEVTSGRIAQVPDMPIGWNVSVENDPSWNTRIDASIIVASAAVSASFFKQFMVVEKNESPGKPFDLKGEITVSRNFSSTRKIHVETKDFTFKEKAR